MRQYFVLIGAYVPYCYLISSFLPDLANLFCSCNLFLFWQINGWLLLLLLVILPIIKRHISGDFILANWQKNCVEGN